MRSQMSGSSVNVEVDAKKQEDLSVIIHEMRAQYEAIIEKNRREMEAWYTVKVREVADNATSSISISYSCLTDDLERI